MALKKSDLYSSLWASCDALRGGIPERDLDALAAYWQVFPGVRTTLFASAGRPGYARLREIKGDREAQDEAAVLRRWLELSESETALKRAVREQEAALDRRAYEKYSQLTEAEIKTLVVDDKWMARLSADLQSELDRVSQTLTGRIRELAERYATPLPQLTDEVEALAGRVHEHLKKMGVQL